MKSASTSFGTLANARIERLAREMGQMNGPSVSSVGAGSRATTPRLEVQSVRDPTLCYPEHTGPQIREAIPLDQEVQSLSAEATELSDELLSTSLGYGSSVALDFLGAKAIGPLLGKFGMKSPFAGPSLAGGKKLVTGVFSKMDALGAKLAKKNSELQSARNRQAKEYRKREQRERAASAKAAERERQQARDRLARAERQRQREKPAKTEKADKDPAAGGGGKKSIAS